MGTSTPNYHLFKPDANDLVNVEVDLATNYDKLDAHTHSGTSVANTPAGNIAATNVQAAINELDSEKVALDSLTFDASLHGVTVGGATPGASLNTLITAVAALGGGDILLPAGTILFETTVIQKTGVRIWGRGKAATICKLANGANVDLFSSYQFATLTTTNTNSGTPEMFGLFDLTLDGNKANQSSGTSYCFRVFACNYDVDGVEIRNGYTGAVWSEWGTSGSRMEARWRNFVIRNSNGTLLDWNGPHDSQFVNGVVCLDTGSATYGIRTRGNAAGDQFTNVHAWGAFTTNAWFVERVVNATNCVAEGALGVDLFVGASKTVWQGSVFGTNGTNPTETGVQIGDGSHTNVGSYVVDIMTWNWGSGSTILVFGSDAGGIIRGAAQFGTATAMSSGTISGFTQLQLLVDDPTKIRSQVPPGVTVSRKQVFAFRATDNSFVDQFRVNTNRSPVSAIEMPNSTVFIGYPDNYVTPTYKFDGATGAMQPGTTAGLGASIYSGAGAPADAMGANGDWYLRTDGVAGLGLYRRLNGIWAVPYVPFAQSDILPTGALAQTLPRVGTAIGDLAALSTGRLTLVGIMLPAGLTITSISFMSRTTPAGVPTNQWFALFNNAASPVLLRQTGDDTTTAWAANTVKTLNLSSTFTTTYSGLHYLGVMVAAGTVPTLAGVSSTASAFAALAPVLNGTSTTGLTTPGSFTSPATAPTATALNPYAYVS